MASWFSIDATAVSINDTSPDGDHSRLGAGELAPGGGDRIAEEADELEPSFATQRFDQQVETDRVDEVHGGRSP